ncbi:MAG: copper resistance protein CopK [Betaproteobacteria bacterium HGW-Betaproteobacteria-12]|jgi:biopolymer transport protein ExbD|nr:MAG: copper resistance protein CopK [Betaproteobacteria bacterium HGW-Betaproteobacteria-12]
MLKIFLMVAAISTVATSAMAVDAAQVEKSIPLKNGATVYIYKDGKMAMEDQVGRPARMKEGQVMETKDGQKLMMHGDEVVRLQSLKQLEGGTTEHAGHR